MVALPSINIRSKHFQMQVLGALSVALLIFIGVHSFLNITKILDIRAQIDTHDKLHNALSDTNKNLGEEVTKVTEENTGLLLKIQNEIEQVFPSTESHTILTRSIEKFANELNRSKDPFLLTNLKYSDSVLSEDESYAILPFDMTIQSSYDNFFKFLQWIENSGTINSGIRILNMPSITINFITTPGAQGNTSGEPEINFTVDVYSYFRNINQEF